MKFFNSENYVVPAATETMLSDALNGDGLVDKFLVEFKKKHPNHVISFGGGVFDIGCKTLLQLCGTAAALKKSAPSLSTEEAKRILSACGNNKLAY